MITAPLVIITLAAVFSAGWTACEFRRDRLDRAAARRRAIARRHMSAVR